MKKYLGLFVLLISMPIQAEETMARGYVKDTKITSIYCGYPK